MTLLANITPRLGTFQKPSRSPDCCAVALFHVSTSGSGNHLLIPPPSLLFPDPRGTESKPLDHLRAPSCCHLTRESSRCSGTCSPGSRRAKAVPATGMGVLGHGTARGRVHGEHHGRVLRKNRQMGDPAGSSLPPPHQASLFHDHLKQGVGENKSLPKFQITELFRAGKG